jgi:hypothetical protein
MIGSGASCQDEFCNMIEKEFASVWVDVQCLLTDIYEQAKVMLDPILPPCDHALIGFGSYGYHVPTPYSDIECAILVSNMSDAVLRYFEALTHAMHIQVIGLGETILPVLGIECLRTDSSSDKDFSFWFNDDGPRGISFNAALPWASTIPTGRHPTKDKNWRRILICTPEQMAEFQNENEQRKEGYHLAQVCRKFAFMAGNEYLCEE